MFSYKGVDKDYNYKIGSVEAETLEEAISKVKEEEQIIIIVSLSKNSKNKMINNIQKTISQKYVDLENKRKAKRKLKKKKVKSPKKKVDKNAPISDKSPILRAIKKVTSPQKKEQKEEVTVYSDLQNVVFKSESSSIETNDLNNLTSTKINSNKKVKKDKDSGKAINWDLLDSENLTPEVKKNMKLKVKEEEILMFTRRLHIMISSGVSLLSALTSLSETSGKNMTIVVSAVLEDIKMGTSFSEAIAKFPRQFNASYVSLISIGETSGELADCIFDIIKMKEQEAKVARKIKSASIYPSIIGAVLGIMMIGMSFFFLPKFTEMFEEQGLQTPKFTQIVFGIANNIPSIAVGIALIVGFIILMRKKNKRFNQVYVGIRDKLLLKIPIVKNVTNALYMYYFSSTIALMLKNGIRLSDTLSLTSRTINNIYIKNEIENVGQLMNNGFSFSEALKNQENFDITLINIALTGEESGKMVFSLSNVAEFYNTDLNTKVDKMLEFVPPLSLLTIGLIAAPVIIAAYLPILDISSGAGLGL